MKNWFKNLFKKEQTKEIKKEKNLKDFFGVFYDFRFEDDVRLRETLDISQKSLVQFCYETLKHPVYIYLINILREKAIKEYLNPERLLDGRDDKQKYRDVISFIAGISKFNEVLKEYASDIEQVEIVKVEDNSTKVYKSVIK